MNTIDVEISHGKIRGYRTKGVSVFKGIPYAGKISGEKRFQRPAELNPWTGIRDAIQLGAPSIQPPRQNEPDPAEDCLFLNIWTPGTDDRKRPVMFYNHGGGFVIGSGGSISQDGSNLARNFDVVVVQTNHRLGLLGFFYLEHLAGTEYLGSGNQGLLDIIAALRWVKINIGSFGGDPDNVLIFGESGGGAKTSCLYAMPEAAPYFNKASIESGPGVRMYTREMAIKTVDLVLKEFDISPKDWRKLLAISTTDLLKVQSKFPPIPPFQEKNKFPGITEPFVGGFGPVVDGNTLPTHPFEPTAPLISLNKPLMVGWNEDEYTFFALESGDTSGFGLDFTELESKLELKFGSETKKIIESYRQFNPNSSATDIFVAISSITMMGLGSMEIVEKKAAQKGAPVYLYNFGYKSEVKIPGTNYELGTPHAMDITFKFNNETPENGPGDLSGGRPDRFIASHQMAELWTNFARTGKPACVGVPDWPAYDFESQPTLRIDTKCEVIYKRFRKELDMWQAIGALPYPQMINKEKKGRIQNDFR